VKIIFAKLSLNFSMFYFRGAKDNMTPLHHQEKPVDLLSGTSNGQFKGVLLPSGTSS